ncbi:hypothetical protein JCM19237_5262 [Photobacterium aphoticum]|uniref:Uncharacterized protein n=1 Tax=Photobacterium aphoticum TaxID=754436 RepID=A0A090QKM5_9GAMM|nr:hypothetical protein JCM19237_5262 [Photobacterium aphoticum]
MERYSYILSVGTIIKQYIGNALCDMFYQKLFLRIAYSFCHGKRADKKAR